MSYDETNLSNKGQNDNRNKKCMYIISRIRYAWISDDIKAKIHETRKEEIIKKTIINPLKNKQKKGGNQCEQSR